jgi:hypothetical protein
MCGEHARVRPACSARRAGRSPSTSPKNLRRAPRRRQRPPPPAGWRPRPAPWRFLRCRLSRRWPGRARSWCIAARCAAARGPRAAHPRGQLESPTFGDSDGFVLYDNRCASVRTEGANPLGSRRRRAQGQGCLVALRPERSRRKDAAQAGRHAARSPAGCEPGSGTARRAAARELLPKARAQSPPVAARPPARISLAPAAPPGTARRRRR